MRTLRYAIGLEDGVIPGQTSTAPPETRDALFKLARKQQPDDKNW
jgi:hypothetical protein